MAIDKFKYETKEIISTIVGVVLIVCTRMFEMYLASARLVPEGAFEWVWLRTVIVAVAAMFFGPVSGLLCGMGGDLLIGVLFMPGIDYLEIFSMGLYGFVIGLYFGRTHFDPAHISGKQYIDLVVTHVITGIFVAVFFVPLVSFLFGNAELVGAVIAGVKLTVGNSIAVSLVCSVIMLVISLHYRRRRGR